MDAVKIQKDFHDYQRITRGISVPVVRQRIRVVRLFHEWISEQGLEMPDGITARNVEIFVRETFPTLPEEALRLKRKQLAERTANLRKGDLRIYLRWLSEEDLLGEDKAPWRRITLTKSPRPVKQKQFAHREEIPAYAARARLWHPRDEAYINFQHYLARRSIEIRTARVGQLDLIPRPGYRRGIFLYDNTKASRYNRQVQIEPDFEPIAKRWLEEYEQLLGRPLRKDDYLIPALTPGKGRTMGLPGVRRNMKVNPERPVATSSVAQLLDRAGVPGSHSLRRGAAVSLKRRLGTKVAREMLDHSSEAITETYMDENREMLEIGELFEAELEKRAKKAKKKKAKKKDESSKATEKAAEVHTLEDLAARRRRRLSAV